jgi:hypothetical protein
MQEAESDKSGPAFLFEERDHRQTLGYSLILVEKNKH